MVSLLSHGRYRPWLAGCAVGVMASTSAIGRCASATRVCGNHHRADALFTLKRLAGHRRVVSACGSQHREIVFGRVQFFPDPSLGRADFDRRKMDRRGRRCPYARNLALHQRVARQSAAYEESVPQRSIPGTRAQSLICDPPRRARRDEYFCRATTSGRCAAMPRCWGWTSAPSLPTWPPCISSRDSGRPVASAPST